MKQLQVLTLALLVGSLVQAQETPVNWVYTAKKVAKDVFEIHCTAIIENGWHVYAQKQPEDAIALPTSFKFVKNPFIVLQGAVKEIGEKKFFKDETVGIAAYQYEEKVDFVQQVQLKIKGKTNLNGTISFQACTNEKCLPPATTDFSVNLED